MEHYNVDHNYECTTCHTLHKDSKLAHDCCSGYKAVANYICPICETNFRCLDDALECRIDCTDKLLDKAIEWIQRFCKNNSICLRPDRTTLCGSKDCTKVSEAHILKLLLKDD